MTMTPDRWRGTCDYLGDVFGRPDPFMATLMPRARAAGLPDIAISADVGRLLLLLTRTTRARRALELGTLAGYSGIWIARGLAAGGRLITIEADPKHAAFARQAFADAGVSDRVTLRDGKALEVLPAIARELGPASLDVVFFDALKHEYEAYFEATVDLIAPGGLLLADNALGSRWWITDPPGDPSRDAVDRFNRRIASDDRFDTACVPIREGVLIARRKG